MLKYTIPILLLATSGLPEQQQCTAYQRDVTIQLGTASTANPDPACVARKGRVRWCSDVGDWLAAFPSDDQSPFPPGHAKHAGKVRTCGHWDQVKICKGSNPCRFKYRSQVNPHPVMDPQVEVEPGE